MSAIESGSSRVAMAQALERFQTLLRPAPADKAIVEPDKAPQAERFDVRDGATYIVPRIGRRR